MTVRWAAFPRRHGDTVSDNLMPEYTKPPAISISVLTLLNNRRTRSHRRSRPGPFVADTALHLGDAPHPGSALDTLKSREWYGLCRRWGCADLLAATGRG